ncbi:hypothetical protein Tco_1043907 [Tanacetum coccineum]|uniref:Reverse transcriptase domain-containing protein n=1 Tax=Tanacetum coccineum TaxID=301880 RepID=A0ABQ5GQK8_9ASTR
MKAKFRSHFSQQKKFTKTHLAVHNIKRRDGESTRAFVIRYTDDTLQILGLPKEQRFSGFVHRLKTRSLVEFLSTDLPTTYKGLMEKTYTWIKEKEVATNGALSDHKESFDRFSKGFSWDNNKGKKKNRDRFSPYNGSNHGLLTNLSKSPREILATKKEAKTFEQPLCMKGDKDIVPVEAPTLMISRRSHASKRKSMGGLINGTWAITFPSISGLDNSFDPVIIRAQIYGRQVNRVYMDSSSSCEVIYEHCFLKLKPSIKSLRVDSKIPLIGFSGEHSWPLEEVPMEITKMGIVVSTIPATIKFHTPRGIGTVLLTYESKKVEEGQKKVKETIPEVIKDFLRWVDTEERIIVNEKYPEQIVVFEKQLLTSFKRKLKPFNTEQKLNEYKHIEPVKQKKRRRNSVKGHILADFLAETPSAEGKDTKIKKPKIVNEEPKLKDMWKLYTDRASSFDGSDAGLMLDVTKIQQHRNSLQLNLWLGSRRSYRNKCRNRKDKGTQSQKNDKRLREDLDILEERREIASIIEAHYKQKLERYYNKHVRPSTFKPGTYVLRLNSASKVEFQGKIGPTWEGPYIVRKTYGDGAYKLETLFGSPVDRTWNSLNLRKLYM